MTQLSEQEVKDESHETEVTLQKYLTDLDFDSTSINKFVDEGYETVEDLDVLDLEALNQLEIPTNLSYKLLKKLNKMPSKTKKPLQNQTKRKSIKTDLKFSINFDITNTKPGMICCTDWIRIGGNV